MGENIPWKRSTWGTLPNGERAAMNSLCDLIKRAAHPGLPKDATVDDCIDCFVPNSEDAGAKSDVAKRALELGLVATALSDFESSILQACSLPAVVGPSSQVGPTPGCPTAQQIQVLSWGESFVKNAYRPLEEVQSTLRMLSSDLSVHNRPSGQRVSRR